MKKVLLLTLLIAFFAVTGFSQTDRFWSSHNEANGKITTDKAVGRLSFPKVFKLYDLNTTVLRQELFSIVGNNAAKQSTTISLPNAAGQIESFEVFEASNFEPDLQAQYPSIRAFSGKGITDKSATLKLSISPIGLQTMIFRTEKENEFIEAYSQNHTVYAVYNSQRAKGQLAWSCTTDDHALMSDVNAQMQNTARPESSAGELKTMRLAQSCNGEYANFFGATSAAQVALVLAAYNATLTRCNGVYEKDLALHLNLIANTTAVIYYNPATDPYTTLGAWNGQLQSTLNSVIGAANYDIGHMFGASGGGGNAGCIGCVCNDANKGSGITSPADGIPQGDNFDIDYVVHEVGHQLGGNHTFSMGFEGSGVNKEVGSGITIMGYAGITAQDVAPHSIDIFHQASIAQIQTNLATKTCPITTNISANNATPVVAAVPSYTIPLSTPFALKGAATDANAGDVLTYCWEQNDNSNSSLIGANSVASPAKISGPNWLTFSPTTNSERTFPRLATILAGNFITAPLPGGSAGANIEALSSVPRNLNFRLTVRDNSPYVSTGVGIKVGQTAFTDMTVTVDGGSGPFMVTSPNTNVSYFAGSTQTITWDVANSTAAPVSCANVKILYSSDGGFTFPIVLAASTANDGSESVVMPAATTTTARIKIESIGNIFFDISNTNFTLTPAPADFVFGATSQVISACPAAATMSITLPTTVTGSLVTPIVLTATAGVPAGTTVSFGTNPITPGNSSVVTLNNANTLGGGTYNITITGTAGTIVKTATLTFVVNTGVAPVITANVGNQGLCTGATATYNVTATGTGVSYQWQMAPSGSTTFTDITTGGTSATLIVTPTTIGMNGNQYRVKVTSTCAPANPTISQIGTLTVSDPVVITQQPTLVGSGCSGTPYVFSAAATGGSLTYQWQSASALAPTTFGSIIGANATNYTIASAQSYLNGYVFRILVNGACVVGGGPGGIASQTVVLKVSDKPSIVLTAPATSSTNASVNQGLFTTISPSNFVGTFNWTKNGATIPNTLTAASILLPVDGIGTYKVSTKDANTGCVSESNIVVIDAEKADNIAKGKLFIYPNPVSNTMEVRFNFPNVGTLGTVLNIFDEKGARVFSKAFTLSNTFGRMRVDMSNVRPATYIAYVMDANGNKLASAKVVKVP